MITLKIFYFSISVSYTHLDVYKRQDLIPLEVNLIDILWNDQRPSLSDASISISNNELQNSSKFSLTKLKKNKFILIYKEESIREKLHKIRLNMDKSQVHHLIIPVSYTHLDVYKRQLFL